jgi:hypothetical protein
MATDVWTPRKQGDAGEGSAIAWLLTQGLPVFVPLQHSPDYDLVSELGGKLIRVQVKTTRVYSKRRWHVSVCTRGGNRSWNGLVKRLDATRYDYLFVLVADGRRWFMPSEAASGGTKICLGGPVYDEYEIDRDPNGLRSAGPTNS